MPTKKEYQGWTNYETWLVALWINNEEGSQRYWDERAEEMLQAHSSDTAYWHLADGMKDDFEEAASEKIPEGFWIDMVGAALSEVDWDEIAKSILDSVKERIDPKPKRRRAREEISPRRGAQEVIEAILPHVGYEAIAKAKRGKT